MPAVDGTANKIDGLGSHLVVRLHGLTVHNRTAGSYGALSTTVQLKGFNLDVIPAPVQGLQGMRWLLMSCTLRQTMQAICMHARLKPNVRAHHSFILYSLSACLWHAVRLQVKDIAHTPS